MCLICDTNMLGELFDRENRSMQPVRNWLHRGGRILYADTPEIKEEMKINSQRWRNFLRGYRRRKRSVLKKIDAEKVRAKQDELANVSLQSNDAHIIALAQAGSTRLLISRDRALHADFTALIKQGSIYQNETHSHLLDGYVCP